MKKPDFEHISDLFLEIEAEGIRVARVFLPKDIRKKLTRQMVIDPNGSLWGAKVLTSKSRGIIEVEGEDYRPAQRARRAKRGTRAKVSCTSCATARG